MLFFENIMENKACSSGAIRLHFSWCL